MEESYRDYLIEQFSNLSRLGLDRPTLQCLKSYGIFEIGDFFSATPEEIFKVEEADLPKLTNAVKKLLDDDGLKRLSERSAGDESLLLTYLTDAIIYRDQEKTLKMLALREELGINAITTQRRLFDSAYRELKFYLEGLTT